MADKTTLFGIYEKHVAAGTTEFTSWCEFREWVNAKNPNRTTLYGLRTLSPEAYDEAVVKETASQPSASKQLSGGEKHTNRQGTTNTQHKTPDPKED